MSQTNNMDCPQYQTVMGKKLDGESASAVDRSVSMKSIDRQIALTRHLTRKYGVRFLPKQVIRREIAKGFICSLEDPPESLPNGRRCASH